MKILNSSFFSDHIIMNDLAEAFPYLSRADFSYKLTFTILGLPFTILGLFFKSFIFGFLNSSSDEATSINIMILKQQCYRIVMSIYFLWFSVAYVLPFSLEDAFGGSFCPYFTALVSLSMFGDIFWGASLAFIRFLSIEHQTFLK